MIQREPSVGFDFSAIDSIADQLMEDFSNHGLTRDAAEAVAKWHTAKVNDAETHVRTRSLVRVIGGLLMAKRLDISVRGLAYALGYDRTNGLDKQTVEAKRIGCSRMAIYKSMEQWKELLEIVK
jgi:hypothetical protein